LQTLPLYQFVFSDQPRKVGRSGGYLKMSPSFLARQMSKLISIPKKGVTAMATHSSYRMFAVFIAGCSIALFFESTARTEGLTVGQAPVEWESIDDQGRPWKSADHVGKKVIVLYFYQGDFTPDGIKQAQVFRDELTKLKKLDIEIIGVSGDSANTHQLFKESHGLTHTLLADPDGLVAKQFGIPVKKGGKVCCRRPDGYPIMDGQRKPMIMRRNVTLPCWTLVFGRDGKLLSRRTDVDPATDGEEVAKILKALPNQTAQRDAHRHD
jgi:peroxiredoxin Q/BCP